jgi:hypothetical protein
VPQQREVLASAAQANQCRPGREIWASAAGSPAGEGAASIASVASGISSRCRRSSSVF